jgi:hypothetical protein
MNHDFPTANRSLQAKAVRFTRHFAPDAPSSRAPDASIKPHGARKAGAAMNKELEAYPKCS